MKAAFFILALGLTAAGQAAARVNLLQNASFETGDFSGWSFSGDPAKAFVTSNPTHVSDGAFGANLGGSGALWQTIIVRPGSRYAMAIDLGRTDGALPNSFTVYLNGAKLFSPVDFPGFPLQGRYSFDSVLTEQSTLYRIEWTNAATGSWKLDSIAVTDVPEPADWTLLVTGFGILGMMGRRRRALAAS